VDAGERNPAALEDAIRAVLVEADLGEVEYAEIVRVDDLTPVTAIEGTCLIAVAVKFGGSGTRLIDNIRVSA